MNYLKHYIKLIRKAEKRITFYGYSEKHHVFPKSIFGDNDRLVPLTSKEHYVAHALLEKIYITRYGIGNNQTYKMIRAFFMMNNMNEYKCSRLYEYNKGRYIDSVKGVPRPEDVLEKMRKPKHSGHGKLVSESRKGMTFSEEHKKNLSEAHKTRTKYAKGYKLTQEHKDKLKIAAKNRPAVTEEYRIKMSLINKEIWAKRKAKKLEESVNGG